MKIVLLALLVGAAGVVWVPSVRNTLSGQTPAGDFADDDDEDVFEDSEPIDPVGGQVPVLPGLTNGASAAPASVDPTPDPALRNFGSKRKPFFFQGPSTSEQENDTTEESLPGLGQIRLWIAENPLTGLMQSSKGHCAIFGGATFREGQRVTHGWTIRAIGAETVELEAEGQTYIARLPRLGEGMKTRIPEDESFDRSADSQEAGQASYSQQDLH